MTDDLRKTLSDLLAEGKTPEAAADAVLTRRDLRQIVRGLLISEARGIVRHQTRRAEAVLRLAWRQDPPTATTPPQPRGPAPSGTTSPSEPILNPQPRSVAAPRAAYQLLAKRSFALPDGTYVEWLKATADQHLDRSKWLRDQAASTTDTAKLHEEAARRIKDAGAECLADIEEAA